MAIETVRVDDKVTYVTNRAKNKRLKKLVGVRFGEEIVSVTRYESGWEFKINIPGGLANNSGN
ncbi:hypothetical protein COB72_06030 [bacterium]|nr:MAG: hypothetical protein COB72_06030 [bacterium]